MSPHLFNFSKLSFGVGLWRIVIPYFICNQKSPDIVRGMPHSFLTSQKVKLMWRTNCILLHQVLKNTLSASISIKSKAIIIQTSSLYLYILHSDSSCIIKNKTKLGNVGAEQRLTFSNKVVLSQQKKRETGASIN